jgi:hypothetical protein
MHIVKLVAMVLGRKPARTRLWRPTRRRAAGPSESYSDVILRLAKSEGGELKSGALPIRPLPHAPCSFLNTRVRIFRDGTPFGRKLIGRHHEFVIKNNGRIGALPFSAPATEVHGPRA